MFILPFILLLQTTVPTTQPIDRTIEIPRHADLHLTVPGDWKQSMEPAAPGLTATVHFVDPTGKLEMLVSILPAPTDADAKTFNSPERLKSIAQKQGEALIKSATEKSLDLLEINGPVAHGYFYTLTDKSPTPGSFEYMTAGVAGTGDVILSATILMHEQNPPARAVALDILRSATQAPASAAPSAQSNPPPTTQASGRHTLSISLPDKSWEVSIDVPADVKLARDDAPPDQHARQIAAVDDSHKLIISLFIEPAAMMGDAKLARQVYFDRLKTSPILMRDDEFTDGPSGSARADYDVPDLDQHHVNLYFSKEGTWIDVHLSLESSKPGEKSTSLDDIVNSVRLEPKQPASR